MSSESPIVAQVRAYLATPASEGADSWARAMTGEMERALVSGYACALTLDNECLRLEQTMHDLALGLEDDLQEVARLRTLRATLGDRSVELAALQDMLGELRVRVAERRRADAGS